VAAHRQPCTPPTFSYPKLVTIRATGIALDHGVEVRRIDGTPVRVTTPAKTVADCFRFRRHVGLDVALEALRDYLRRNRNGMDALMAAARADRVYSVLRPYIEAVT